MPAAPSLAAICDHESQFCVAARTILSGGGFADPRTPGDTRNQPATLTAIKFYRDDAVADGTRLVSAAPRREFSQWTGTLEILYAQPRTDNDDSAVDGLDRVMGEKRGLIRSLFMKSVYPFDGTNLPWLIVLDIKPLRGDEGIDKDRHLDVIVERFQVTYEVRSATWPV
jgi:hypothetical protein